MRKPKEKRLIRTCEHSQDQEMFFRYMKERNGLSYSALCRMGISLLMKQYNIE